MFQPAENGLYERVVRIIETARQHVARSVNTAMVHAYWLIGREIVQVEQQGKERAAYGEQVLKHLSQRLSGRFGKGFSVPNLRNMRQFYLSYPQGTALPEASGGPRKRQTPPSISGQETVQSGLPGELVAGHEPLFPPSLGWTHYAILMIHASRYQLYLPTEEELKAELTREREEVEQALRINAAARSQPKSSEGKR